MLFLFITPSIYLLAPPLGVVTIMSLGCSFVMLNAFLPLLASNHPTVRAQEKELLLELSPSRPVLSPAEPYTAPLPPKDSPSPALAFSNAVSARGVGLGYAAAVFVQILCIIILVINSKYKISTSPTIPLRLAIFLSSTWWLIFTIPSYLWLRNRPGPPLPAHLSPNPSSSLTPTRATRLKANLRKILTYTLFAWSSLYRTLLLALRLTQLRTFLLAWFLMSDAIATVGSTAIMFARTELHLSPTGVALLSISATCSGILGTLIWPHITRAYGLRSSRTIVCCLCVMECVPLYGLLGYIPFVQRLGWLGLQQAWEIYPLSIIYGIAMGGLSSYCRSFFGQLIPRGKEAAFYALFAITDKGSSAIGPAVVGRIVDHTGTIRPAFWFLLVLIGVPIGLVWLVDERRGKNEAEGMADGGVGGSEMEMHGSRGNGVEAEEAEGLMRRGSHEEDGGRRQ
jgi:MFS transporter, UMF1 family